MTTRYATYLSQIDQQPKPYASPNACPEMLAAGFEKIRWGGYSGQFGGKYYEVAFGSDGQATIRQGMLRLKTTFKRGTDAETIREIMETLAEGRVPEVTL